MFFKSKDADGDVAIYVTFKRILKGDYEIYFIQLNKITFFLIHGIY